MSAQGETLDPAPAVEESWECFLRAHFQDRFVGKIVPLSQNALETQLQREGRSFTLVSVKTKKRPG